ncbi:glutathione S-transferase [Gluconacetobacter sacchari DSM 12717]|uniref:Glutathione S-transferase n=2 Tax=Gluconacetobacter sacchari TaxID=92759 RepID=A0A7W4IG27_9PROT|nr:glutathione S-transferase [Gluconacetobacter sacchari]MBB2162190.1 glutathione S-transferase [Gluconacetobacter sacchari]GBQ24070.1 glutathione S-transferase [Gluconacetobacter sacchari DSM 12717]
MKLYDLDVSGNCYKVRLFAALAGVPLDLQSVDLIKQEHHSAVFTDLNPFQEVPVLIDGDAVVRDSQAILVYLAGGLPDRRWWPDDHAAQAEIVAWLSVAASEIRNGPNAARLIKKFRVDLDLPTAIRWSEKVLPILNKHLEDHEWLALRRPTIADCAIFPYLSVAHEGGIDVTAFPALLDWMTRVTQLPGFIPMPNMLMLPQ